MWFLIRYSITIIKMVPKVLQLNSFHNIILNFNFKESYSSKNIHNTNLKYFTTNRLQFLND